jgi:prepilin-type N-terminal cleavage/methylation domain-containing protein
LKDKELPPSAGNIQHSTFNVQHSSGTKSRTLNPEPLAPSACNLQPPTSNVQHSSPEPRTPNPEHPPVRARSGFTLLEILVAVTLLATAFTIIMSTFSATLDGWRRSGEFLDRITHGDFVIDQMVASLRSTAYFKNRPEKYGFWLDSKGGGDAPSDSISWVTSGTAFMLPEDPLANGMYRIMLSVEDEGLAVRSAQHMKDELEMDDVDPWFVSPRVKGLGCRVYNFEEEDWDDEWENTNEIPSLVEITLFLEPVEKGEPMVKLQRIVEIPLAPAVTGAVTVARGTEAEARGEDETQQGSQPNEQQGSAPSGAPKLELQGP